MKQLTSAEKLHISKSIRVPYGFTQTDAGDFQCEYELHGEPKVFHRKPLGMANLLKEYGFIDNYKLTTAGIYVMYCPVDETDAIAPDQRTDLLEDFMDEISQFHALLIITEFEGRELNRQERAAAFKLSCDSKQFSSVIN